VTAATSFMRRLRQSRAEEREGLRQMTPEECHVPNEEIRLRCEAQRAERWARALTDARMIERLLDLAREYTRRADALQRRPAGS
jgi:hypothetical protein